MDKKEVKKRIEKLKTLIDHHRYLYHVLDRQEISDEALDSLKKELFNLEQQYPEFITADSPTQRVGGEPLKAFAKVTHKKRMLSFNDAFSKEDMEDWQERLLKLLKEGEASAIDFYCELKIDGLAVELIYEGGILKAGATRGDGVIGENITQNLKTVEAIPLVLQSRSQKNDVLETPSECIARGEVFISKKEFEAVNKLQKEKGLPLYANPRNIAAGSVRQLDPKITALRHLDFFAYDLVAGFSLPTHEQKHVILKSLGFKVDKYSQYCKSLKEVFAFYERCLKLRKTLAYEIDGIVVTVNNNAIFEKLGVVGKAPRGAIAFKFPQSQAVTKVVDIKIQVGRTGAITPVAVLAPVQVSGITITRATLHNEDEIKRLGLKIGDTIIIGRAGDVIPDVIKVLPELRTGKEKNFMMPKICPSCKTGLKKIEAETILRCPNPKCFAKQRRLLYHFVSRDAFNIEGLGPKIIDKLLDEGLIQDPSDLFTLKEGDLTQLKRFAEKSVYNLLYAIAEKKEITLAKFIYALGVMHIGQETANDLTMHFSSIEALKKAKQETLESISNIGPVVAKSLYEWFNDKRNLLLLDKLFEAGVKVKNPKIKGGKLQEKIFVFTGSLSTIDRNKAKEKVRELSGEVSESVSEKTSFIVIGENPGSKLKKGKELGIKIIDEKEFLDMVA